MLSFYPRRINENREDIFYTYPVDSEIIYNAFVSRASVSDVSKRWSTKSLGHVHTRINCRLLVQTLIEEILDKTLAQ